jgi:pimeloyl-ACP methyl ester carboxylesterase
MRIVMKRTDVIVSAMSVLLTTSVLLATESSDQNISEDAGVRCLPMQEDVRFANGQVQLDGSLFWPASKSTRGAVVVLAGSDRSKRGPLRIRIAKIFAKLGIAALVYDSPGTGTSTGNALLQNRDDRATEALSAVNYLRKKAGIPSASVGIFGGSEGADVAIMAAARDSEISFVIATSGAIGVSIFDIMRYSAEKRGLNQGLNLEEITKAITFKEITYAFLSGLDIVEWPLVESRVTHWHDNNWAKLIDVARKRQQRLSRGDKDEILSSFRQVVGKFEAQRWFAVADVGNSIRRLLALDADRFFSLLEGIPFSSDWDRNIGHEVATMTCPVLAIWGEEDTFLPPHQSATRLMKYLKDSNHRDYEIRILRNASHALTVPGSTTEFVPEYVETVASWLDRHIGLDHCVSPQDIDDDTS